MTVSKCCTRFLPFSLIQSRSGCTTVGSTTNSWATCENTTTSNWNTRKKAKTMTTTDSMAKSKMATDGGGLLSEEEGLVAEHVDEHLQVVLAHLDDLVGRVDADARGAYLLQALRSGHETKSDQ